MALATCNKGALTSGLDCRGQTSDCDVFNGNHERMPSKAEPSQEAGVARVNRSGV